MSLKDFPVSIAPMMKRTDRHFRFIMRQLSRRTLLYTEMVTATAIIHGDRERLLGYDPAEHPIALQIGGSDPKELQEAARIAANFGYDEINLNVGCPSDRVQNNAIGACLMLEPDRVARAVEALRDAVRPFDIEVTVKHRIGVDDVDRYEDMLRFVDTVSNAGCQRFTVHARKAWLKGLSPKENRNVPPLRYDEVYRLKQERPHLDIEINGGIKTHEAIKMHLEHVDAVMIGRAAYDDPYLFADVDQRYFGSTDPVITRHEVVQRLYPYIEESLSRPGTKLNHITMHLLQLFARQPGGRQWRRHLSENAFRDDATLQVLEDGLKLVPEDLPEEA